MWSSNAATGFTHDDTWRWCACAKSETKQKKEKKREAVNKRERDWKRLSKLNGLLCMRGPALSPLTKIIHESRNEVHSTSIIFQKVTNRTKKKKKNHLGDYVEMLISLHGDYVLPMDLKVRLVSVPSRRWKTFNESSSWLGSHTPPKPKKIKIKIIKIGRKVGVILICLDQSQ